MELSEISSGALAGAVAAAVWAAQQPLDKRVFGSDYDDVELLGKLFTRDSGWQAAGLAIHMANGAAFGAVYALLRPLLPGPPQRAGVAAGLGEHVALWPLGALIDRPTRALGPGAAVGQPPGVRAGCLAPRAVRPGARRARAPAQPRGPSSSRSSRCRSRRTATATSSTRPRERRRHRVRARRRNRTDNLFITSEVLCQLS